MNFNDDADNDDDGYEVNYMRMRACVRMHFLLVYFACKVTLHGTAFAIFRKLHKVAKNCKKLQKKVFQKKIKFFLFKICIIQKM